METSSEDTSGSRRRGSQARGASPRVHTVAGIALQAVFGRFPVESSLDAPISRSCE